MSTSAKLTFFYGKMAAGKSTLARNLAIRENAVLLVQDDFLNVLFPGEITDIPGFVKRSSREVIRYEVICYSVNQVALAARQISAQRFSRPLHSHWDKL